MVAGIRGKKAVLPRPRNNAGHVTLGAFIVADASVSIPGIWLFTGKKFMKNHLAGADPGAIGACTGSGSLKKEVNIAFLCLYSYFSFLPFALLLLSFSFFSSQSIAFFGSTVMMQVHLIRLTCVVLLLCFGI